jgi:hypothetical protein
MPKTTMESLDEFKRLLAAPELREPRRIACRTLAGQLAACGERLWAFGSGPTDFRTACSVVIQFGGSLASGAVALGEQENWYAASALVRQIVEVEYLIRLFRQDSSEGLRWLKASPEELRTSFLPAQMRKRAEGFRHQEYRVHCESGGHPNPRAHTLLPSRVVNAHLPPLGTNEVFWVDLAQHLRRVWRDIVALPVDHPTANLGVVDQYATDAANAIAAWEAVDPCAPMLTESLLADWNGATPRHNTQMEPTRH